MRQRMHDEAPSNTVLVHVTRTRASPFFSRLTVSCATSAVREGSLESDTAIAVLEARAKSNICSGSVWRTAQAGISSPLHGAQEATGTTHIMQLLHRRHDVRF